MKEDTKMIPLVQVAARLGVRPGTIRQWIKRGHISGYKQGRDWYFTETQIAERKPSKAGRPRTKN